MGDTLNGYGLVIISKTMGRLKSQWTNGQGWEEVSMASGGRKSQWPGVSGSFNGCGKL